MVALELALVGLLVAVWLRYRKDTTARDEKEFWV